MKPTPKESAIGGAIITPFTVVLLVAIAAVLLIVAACLLICWPIVPLLLYKAAKEKLVAQPPVIV